VPTGRMGGGPWKKDVGDWMPSTGLEIKNHDLISQGGGGNARELGITPRAKQKSKGGQKKENPIRIRR